MGCDSDCVASLDWGGQERSLKIWHSSCILNYKKQPARMSGIQYPGEEQGMEAKQWCCDLNTLENVWGNLGV